MRCGILSFVLLLGLSLAGCATVKDTIVLVQDADGTVGQVTVTTKGGARTLTAPNTVVKVADSGKMPTMPEEISRQQIDLLFSDSLKALPPEPVSFLFYFLHGTMELTSESKAYIPEVLTIIKKRDFYELSIIGHTDTTGTDEHNMKLSADRAATVRDMFLSHGIRSGFMELSYHGKRDLLVPTMDNVREPRNRRVEVVVK
ncbi:MAG: OmpA/MotB domain-containing protein [Nitrospirae bacterium]|nr:MAG: OmpA/MotB domain-containing protein [Nitrospirota bacterium]